MPNLRLEVIQYSCIDIMSAWLLAHSWSYASDANLHVILVSMHTLQNTTHTHTHTHTYTHVLIHTSLQLSQQLDFLCLVWPLSCPFTLTCSWDCHTGMSCLRTSNLLLSFLDNNTRSWNTRSALWFSGNLCDWLFRETPKSWFFLVVLLVGELLGCIELLVLSPVFFGASVRDFVIAVALSKFSVIAPMACNSASKLSVSALSFSLISYLDGRLSPLVKIFAAVSGASES